MNTVTISTPVVTIKNEQVVTTSRDVAEYFGKAHSVVIRKVDDLISDLPISALNNFVETPETNQQNGQTYRYFEMTRDGFTLLAMGFTGKKALQFKLAYIAQFNAMEEKLKGQAVTVTSDNSELLSRMDALERRLDDQFARLLIRLPRTPREFGQTNSYRWSSDELEHFRAQQLR